MRNFDITLIWLGFFAAVFLAWYFYLKARNKERMALIEGGKDVSEIFSKREIKLRFPWLKLGIILTGASFGFLTSFIFMGIIMENTDIKISGFIGEESIIFGFAFFCTAVSVIIAYFADKPKK